MVKLENPKQSENVSNKNIPLSDFVVNLDQYVFFFFHKKKKP